MKYLFVFYVYHQYISDFDKKGDPIYEKKEIGLYSNKKNAKDAVKRFQILPGFSKYKDGFQICKKRCYVKTNQKVSVSHMKIVFSPYHEYYLPAEECDIVTRGAFYQDREEAQEELDKWKNEKKFSKYPEGFNIIEYTIDRDIRFWSEGFE